MKRRKMNLVRCAIEGCLEVFKTAETLSPNARFICKNHPRKVQVEAVGRKYDVKKDETDQDVHFQDCQFDPEIKRAAKAINTHHIQHQGSEVLDADEIKWMREALGHIDE